MIYATRFFKSNFFFLYTVYINSIVILLCSNNVFKERSNHYYGFDPCEFWAVLFFLPLEVEYLGRMGHGIGWMVQGIRFSFNEFHKSSLILLVIIHRCIRFRTFSNVLSVDPSLKLTMFHIYTIILTSGCPVVEIRP